MEACTNNFDGSGVRGGGLKSRSGLYTTLEQTIKAVTML